MEMNYKVTPSTEQPKMEKLRKEEITRWHSFNVVSDLQQCCHWKKINTFRLKMPKFSFRF